MVEVCSRDLGQVFNFKFLSIFLTHSFRKGPSTINFSTIFTVIVTLANETVSTGHYMIYWDGRNDKEEKVKLAISTAQRN